MSAPTKTIRELTRMDRCDRCGAAATVALQLKSGSELMFCGHHLQEYNIGLTVAGAVVVGVPPKEDS